MSLKKIIFTILGLTYGLEISDTICASGSSIVPCSYIQSNADYICETTLTSGIVNGESCHLEYSGCVFNDYVSDVTTNVLCEVSTISPSSSFSVGVSGSSIQSPTASGSQNPTTTCSNYRTYASNTDFSSTQGINGWYYGYYNGGSFVPFTVYTTNGFTNGYYSWMYSAASNGFINSVQIMPNGPGSCNTASYGTISPVIRWYNPTSSCYQDVTITLYAYQAHTGGDGVAVTLAVNGGTILSQTNNGAGALSINNEYKATSVRSVELTIGPVIGCDYDQTDYVLTIQPLKASFTPTNTATSTSSLSVSKSPSSSAAESPSYGSRTASSSTNSSASYGSRTTSSSASQSASYGSRSDSASASTTKSVSITSSISASTNPTTSLIGVFSHNMCSSSGRIVTLPYSQSYISIITNVAGTVYSDSANCQITVYKPVGTIFNISFSRFSTESCCDFLRITESTGTSILYASGVSIPSSLTSSSSYITLTFTTDTSVILSGIGLEVMAIDTPPSLTSAATPTITAEARLSSSAHPSLTITSYTSESRTAVHSISSSPDTSESRTAVHSISSSPDTSESRTAVHSISSSPSMVESNSHSPSASPSISSSISESASYTTESSVSYTSYKTYTPYESFSESVQNSYTSCISNTHTNTMVNTISQTPMHSTTRSVVTSSSPTISPSAKRVIPSNQAPPALPKNLSALSKEQILGFFTELSHYNPLLIKDSLKDLGFAGLSKSGSGVFAVSTDAFDLKMKRLENTSSMDIGNADIGIPSIPNSSAASAIQWTTNPYGSGVLDTPVLSLSVLGGDGKEISVKNLSTPITLEWSIKPDERFETPPTYMINCVKGNTYISQDGAYSTFTNYTIKKSGVWTFPCLLGVMKDVTCLSTDVIREYTCPPPILTPLCMYWNTAQGNWSTDGCVPELVGTKIKCHCTHLTDFSTRVNAVGEQNAAIFANARNVYSLGGLEKYANWYGIFGSIAFLTIILGAISSRIDYLKTHTYVLELYNNKSVKEFLLFKPKFPIYIYSKHIAYNGDYEEPPKKTFTLCQRVCFQHNRIQFLFRYDPRLSRMFRLIGLFALQFHSLFITALLYGFTYNSASAPMQWYDNIILSLITSALNIPAIRLLIGGMNYVGMAEFTHQFPYLAEEYKRRVEFEQLGLAYLNKDLANKGESLDSSMVADGDSEDIFSMIAIYLCCRDSSVKKENLMKLEKEELLVRMKNIIERSFKKCEVYDKWWSIFPCHTMKGLLFTMGAFGWLGWCLNYLLLFSANHDKSVGENIMISYATSEIVTVFISQPVAILVSLGVFSCLQKYSKNLPLPNFIKKFLVIKPSNGIPALQFFSNPWSSQSKTMLTSEFAYALFVQAPARASGVSELTYAPVKAVIPSLVDEEVDIHHIHEKVVDLYKKFIDTKMKYDSDI